MLKKIILVQFLILARHFNLKTGLSQNPNFGHSQFLPSTLDMENDSRRFTNNLAKKLKTLLLILHPFTYHLNLADISN